MATEIEMYAQLYPETRTVLAFLQAILTFQAGRAAQIEPAPGIALEAAQARWRDGLPLLDAEYLAVPHAYMQETLVAMHPVLSQNTQAEATLSRLLASSFAGPSADEAYFYDLTRDGRERIEKLAAAIAVDPALLKVVLHAAIAPLYQQRAIPYRLWLEPSPWLRGDCPICGAEPSMARLTREDGRRILVCSLCRSEWAYARLRCPFCTTDNRPQLRHFTVDDDPVHRVDCCEQCRRYLKTVDGRRADYKIYIPAEELVTTYLDVLAHEQGYQ